MTTDKHACKNETTGPAFDEKLKQPTPYMHKDHPANEPHPEIHESGVGGPSDRNNNGVDDSEE